MIDAIIVAAVVLAVVLVVRARLRAQVKGGRLRRVRLRLDVRRRPHGQLPGGRRRRGLHGGRSESRRALGEPRKEGPLLLPLGPPTRPPGFHP